MPEFAPTAEEQVEPQEDRGKHASWTELEKRRLFERKELTRRRAEAAREAYDRVAVTLMTAEELEDRAEEAMMAL